MGAAVAHVNAVAQLVEELVERRVADRLAGQVRRPGRWAPQWCGWRRLAASGLTTPTKPGGFQDTSASESRALADSTKWTPFFTLYPPGHARQGH